MKLKYLGTAAAEGIPALFCNCPVCKKSKQDGGRNFRSRSQALVNNDLLLDFGPDSYWHTCRFGVDYTKIKYCLITHAHDDHYSPFELSYRGHGFAYLSGSFEDDDKDYPRLELYISKGSYEYAPAQAILGDVGKRMPIDFNIVRAFETFTMGKYTVTPLEANHAPGMEALNYIVSDGTSTLLYAHDTGLFTEKTVAYLAEKRPYFDFVSIDCTGMVYQCGDRHMNLEDNKKTRAQLADMGCVDDKTVFCCNHFSHNGRATHDEFVPIAEAEGFMVSYDGMEAEF